jgi:hypothetical protein
MDEIVNWIFPGKQRIFGNFSSNEGISSLLDLIARANRPIRGESALGPHTLPRLP